jgi:hypothetical protein
MGCLATKNTRKCSETVNNTSQLTATFGDTYHIVIHALDQIDQD